MILLTALGFTQGLLECLIYTNTSMNPLKIIFLAGLCFALTNCTPIEKGDQKHTNQEEELYTAIDKFNLAFETGDIVTLDSMVTENYQHTNGNSKAISKGAWFNYLNKRKADIENGKLKVIAYTMDEKKVEFFGNTALLTARISVKSERDGELQENQYRITNFWIKESGKWKRAGFHDGKIL